MKIITTINLILFALLITSCDKHEIKESKYPDGVLHEKYSVLQDANGSFIKDGEYQEWYFSGQTQKKGSYEWGNKIGTWNEWFKSGQIDRIANYANDTLNGEFKTFFKNGQLREEGTFQKDTSIGNWRFWNSKALLVKEVNYDLRGELNGVQKSWHSNGIIASEENFISGIKNGEIKYWNSDSILYYNRKFDNGVDLELPATYKNKKGEKLTLNQDGTYKIIYYYKDMYSFFSKARLKTTKGNYEFSAGTLNLIGLREYTLSSFTEEKITIDQIKFYRLK